MDPRYSRSVLEPRVLVIVPTLGSRTALLGDCLDSITSQEVPADIVVVSPDIPEVKAMATAVGASWTPDPGGLAAAINAGAATAQSRHEYLNWIGDDDLLEAGSLALTVSALDRDPGSVLAYGACRYIDDAGRKLWISRAGKWAPRILSWGPDLIPQPGMLVRRDAWERTGGVDESMRFAFDLDLLLKLKPQGRFVDVGEVVSSFRWHADSLTVSDRTMSLQESETARRRSLSPGVRRWAWLWEKPVRGATRLAAAEVSRRARRLT